MLGLDQFAKMKPGSYFINTARGGIHREDELAEALKCNLIAGAGIDVFLQEPPAKDHPLLQFDNVIATPHNAGLSVESTYNMAVAAAEQWITLLKGRVPPRIINPDVWDRYCSRFEAEFGIRPPPLSGEVKAKAIPNG